MCATTNLGWPIHARFCAWVGCNHSPQRRAQRHILPTMRSLLILCLACIPVTAAAQSPTTRCQALTALTLDHAKITSATLTTPATNPGGTNLPAAFVAPLPAFCRVILEDHPSADSNIQTEVWLPASGWNGKLRGVGNGGFAGDIYYKPMASAVAAGYATVGTDTGHTGVQSTFALAHPEKVKDFGWRAIHDMTVQAKQIVTAFYGKPAHLAYFTGCSDGGREALMEAQRFPADYNGILAGAPAYNWTALVSSGAADEQQLHASPAANIPISKLPAIANAVRAACDANDGVKDGILSDPTHCGFDPATLACKSGDSSDSNSCLSPQQVASLKNIYSAKFDAQGKKIFPGYLPGSEDAPGSWAGWVLGDHAAMLFFSNGYFSDFIYQQPNWQLQTFDLQRDYKRANETTAEALNATDTNLKPFLAHGGRLILYHGWADPAIPALSTVDYYNGVVATVGSSATSSAVRLYMAPGMLHCDGGPGPNNFGQGDPPAFSHDAQHDLFYALDLWVEKGTAPATLTATKFKDNDPTKPVTMTRPLCPYPAKAKYLKGDPNEAQSFTCSTTNAPANEPMR
jgi:hypothetical protein